MATEVTSENVVEASPTIAEPEETTTETTISQDVTNTVPQVNGEPEIDGAKADTDQIDGAVNSAEVSVNGGSDSEALQTEASKQHLRSTSSVKKPTSFKAVSVNKTFLAAKTAPAKPGDKSSVASTPAVSSTSTISRPRLVAKTGSGLRDSTPRTSSSSNGGKPGTAPDASAVWNKNRPASLLADNKRITDEELSQKFGIHLASRLQSDDPNRQANWADIDDDDDDWAPETIEWTDGTKFTLPQQTDEPAAIPPPTSVEEVVAADSTKPKSPAPSGSVKLGGISGVSGKGLVLKGAAEKPTLVAKPPGPPTPVKSPWAQLPPVDKVPPISIELQAQEQQRQTPTRFNQRDPHGFDAMPPPAKEIAADDFSRSWREGHSSGNRELFNSQSGRYEPVNDNRRGSGRDSHSRQPAVLQRPSQHEQQGPAEPSPAFQTHRASGQDGLHGRRRTSSNVSGGSGNFGRRMSRGQETHPPHDALNARRGSLVAVSDAPSSPRLQSPSGTQGGQSRYSSAQWQTRASPVVSHASPASTHGQIVQPSQPSTPAIPFEDEVELQKKIMRESRELARKRRLEEEAKEEAERKERIRLKLEAMGPAPEKKKKETPKQEKAVPTQIQTREPSAALVSPPKPPVPEVAGEVKQYGMMKVHHPESVSVAAAESSMAHFHEKHSGVGDEHRLNGVNQTHANRERDANDSQTHLSQDRHSQPWQTSAPSGSDRFSNWAPPHPQSSQGRNVWGPPTNDKTLGNGTFNSELSRISDIHGTSSQMSSTNPGPIGPPNAARHNGSYQNRSRDQYGQRPGPIAPPHRPQALSQDQQRASAAWKALPSNIAEEDARIREQQEKEEAARRERAESGIDIPQPVYKDTWRQVSLNEDGTRTGIQSSSQVRNDGTVSTGAAAWKDFGTHLAQQDETERIRYEQQEATRRQLEASGQSVQPVYKDTWRQVQLENGVRSEIIGSSIAVHGNNSLNSSPPVRGSRFFPQSRDVRLEDPNVTFARPGSPSPPPPTQAGHPAYDGDSSHPLVSLPRPAPVVRLPPTAALAPIGPPKPNTFAAAAAATSAGSQNSQAKQQDSAARFRSEQTTLRPTLGQSGGAGGWQDRINTLIGRKSSPTKPNALTVDSASKSALELPSSQALATVSLPAIVFGDPSVDETSFETKPMAEECFEEQEMGSLPTVHIPNKAPEAAWHMAPVQTKPLPKRFALTDVTTAEPYHFHPELVKNEVKTTILLPGMTGPKVVNVPYKAEGRSKSNPRRGGQSRGGSSRHASSHHPRGVRSKESSNGFPSTSGDNLPSSPSPSAGSRGGSRGRGGYNSSWNNHNSHRHVSAPPNAINT